MAEITLSELRSNETINALIRAANDALAVLGYTEHGPRHVGYVSRAAANILENLHYSPRMVELAAMAGWIHDVGNAVNRTNHGITGATLLLPILREIGLPMEEIMILIGAVGNHEEQNGTPINPVSAAVIIADKSDAHRTRVRKGHYDPKDIHDRVNYAIKKNWIEVDSENHVIRFAMEMDNSSSVMDFMQIYLTRMFMCEKSARLLGCRFEVVINERVVNTQFPL
jgi:metal-dependent HD superfamily phosphatase/phosphodiesterase